MFHLNSKLQHNFIESNPNNNDITGTNFSTYKAKQKTLKTCGDGTGDWCTEIHVNCYLKKIMYQLI